MPFQRKLYPDDWEEISRRIRFERAQGKCEWCGAPHGVTLWRLAKGYWFDLESKSWRTAQGNQVFDLDMMFLDAGVPGGEWDYNEEGFSAPLDEKYLRKTRCCLTVAHLGAPKPDGTAGDKHDKMDVRDENLSALCNSCHIRYDAADHAANAARTRREKRERIQPVLALEV